MTLKPLTVSEIIALVDEVDRLERAKLVTTLEDAGADMDTKLRELKQHDRVRGNITQLAVYAQTTAGAQRIIEVAAKRDGVAVPQLDPSDGMIREAFRLIGWDVDELAKAGQRSDPTLSLSRLSATG